MMTTTAILTKTQKCCLTLALALALTLVWTTLAHADGPGDLDITFGGTGVVTTSIGSNARGNAVAIQSDGKIVVAGFGTNANSDFAVARYDSNGNLDTSFNTTGIVTAPIDFDGEDIGNSVAIQADGKIVVAGVRDNFGSPNFAVARYTITGTLDSTFNGTGVVETSLSGGNPYGNSVAIQDDGKIVVVGGSDAFGFSKFMIVRYTTTGGLDTTFNSTGIVTTPIDLFAAGTSVAIQDDGAIVVAGASSSTTSNFAVARYDTNGNLDTSFNGTGVITTPVSSFGTSGASMVIQPDSKIVVAGNSLINLFAESDLTVLRYTSTGALDTTFGNNGLVTTPINSGDEPTGIALQSNGKIVVTSLSRGAGNSTITVVRYHSDGTLDSTFGTDGIVTTSIGGNSSFDSGRSVALQDDGKIVVAGINQGNNSNLAVVRYFSNGTRLSLTKTVDDEAPDPGQVITYSLAMSNSGNVTATNALISDTLPTGLTLAGPVTLDPPGAGTIGTLPTLVSGLTITPGKSITVTFPVTVNTGLSAGIHLTNTASISSPEISIPVTGTAVITIAMIPLDDPSPPTLTKTVDDSVPNPGQLITYTLSISNTGSFSTTNLLISDTLPLSLTLAGPVTLEPPQPGAILATSALSLPTVASSVTISPMTSLTVTIPVTVNTELTGGLHLTNTATITSPEMSIPVSDRVVITIATIATARTVYLPIIMKD